MYEKSVHKIPYCVKELMPIADEVKIRCFDVVFVEMLGGASSVEMLNQYHVDGMSVRDISEIHQIAPMTIQDRLERSREKLRKCGLWPADWEDRTKKRTPEPALSITR